MSMVPLTFQEDYPNVGAGQICYKGGSSGKIDFPEHMKNIHQDWMGYSGSASPVDTDVIQVMNNSLGTGGNPYENISLTDPSSDFSAVQTRYDSYETAVNNLDEETDWASIMDSAVSKIDSTGVLNEIDTTTLATAARSGAENGLNKAISFAVDAINSNLVKDAVVQYQRRSNVQKERSISRFSRTMADVNAVNSSAYMFGLAMIEAQHLQDVDQFQSQLEIQTYDRMIQNYTQYFKTELEARLRVELNSKQSRDKLLSEAVQVMSQLLGGRIQAFSNSTQLLNQVKKTKTAALQDYELGDADLNYKFSKWDFEVFNMASNVFGAIHGSAGQIPAQPSKAGSAISGALGGASAGAAFGPVGMGVGAALGAGSALI